MNKLAKLALQINQYFTPERRQAVNRVLAIVGVLIVAVNPAMSDEVQNWTQVIYGAATVFMLIIAAIVTRSPQWPVIYTAVAALITALVGVSVLTPALAESTNKFLALVVQAIPSLLILTRIKTSDPVGSPDGVPVADPDGTVRVNYPDGTSLIAA